MADEKRAETVTRAEFYSTISLVFLLPAILYLGSDGFPVTLLGQVSTGLVLITMIGMSLTYGIMAMRERGQRARDKNPVGPS